MVKEYHSLEKTIEKYSSKPFSELPSEIQKRVTENFSMASWDSLDEIQRIEFAHQFDFHKDPSHRRAREYISNLGIQRVEIKKKLEMWKTPQKIPSEELYRKALVVGLEEELSDIEKKILLSTSFLPVDDDSERSADIEAHIHAKQSGQNETDNKGPTSSNWVEIHPPKRSGEFARLLFELINEIKEIPETRSEWASLLVRYFGESRTIKRSDRTGASLIFNEKTITHAALNMATGRVKKMFQNQTAESQKGTVDNIK